MWPFKRQNGDSDHDENNHEEAAVQQGVDTQKMSLKLTQIHLIQFTMQFQGKLVPLMLIP